MTKRTDYFYRMQRPSEYDDWNEIMKRCFNLKKKKKIEPFNVLV